MYSQSGTVVTAPFSSELIEYLTFHSFPSKNSDHKNRNIN